MRTVLLPFLVLAVVGLLLSLVSHAAALLHLPQPLGEAAWCLHVGVFFVWIPAVIVASSLSKDFKRSELWKAALRGCPTWMQWMTYGFFAYAILNFVLFIAVEVSDLHAVHEEEAVVSGFSGHWMAFYAAAVAILYSGYVVSKLDPVRRCPNGHPVSNAAEFCESCGTRIIVRG